MLNKLPSFKIIVNKSNLKRKVIRITWKKNIFFKRGQMMHLNSHLIKYKITKWSKK